MFSQFLLDSLYRSFCFTEGGKGLYRFLSTPSSIIHHVVSCLFETTRGLLHFAINSHGTVFILPLKPRDCCRSSPLSKPPKAASYLLLDSHRSSKMFSSTKHNLLDIRYSILIDRLKPQLEKHKQREKWVPFCIFS